MELVPPVDSLDGVWTESYRAAAESKLRSAIVGSETTVEVALERLVAATGAAEVIVVTDTWDHAARLKSYQRVSEVAGRIEAKATVRVRR